MKINSVSVLNFRNLKQQSISFAPGLNVVFGKNAQGKTNLLEAIYFSTIGKSPRTHKDAEAINFSQKHANIRLNYQRGTVEHSLEINLKLGAKKTVFVDGGTSVKLIDMVGQFGSVYFSPDELKLVQGSPSVRRRFVDIINCQLDKQYLNNLQMYNRLIMQRNNLLKQKPQNLKQELYVWDNLLVKTNAQIAFKRQNFVKLLNASVGQIHKNLSDNTESLFVVYERCGENELSQQQFLDMFSKQRDQSFEKDVQYGYTTFGVHCDDFLLQLNGLDARKNGSQGQQRTATLALKLAEMEILKQEYGEYPVLLLDDVLSELDKARREKLVSYFKNIQCVLTCTDFDLPLECNKFEMVDGVIKNVD